MSSQFFVKCAMYLCSFLIITNIAAQSSEIIKPVAREISESKLKKDFSKIEIFNPFTPSTERVMQTDAFATNITFTTVDAGVLESLYNEKKDAISLSIPYRDEVLELELIQVHILSSGFKVTSALGGDEAYNPGIYYRGIIKDDPNSIVAISIFQNEIFGVASSQKDGNINIGRNKKPGALENEYMLYSDKDILVDYENKGCATPEPEGYESTFHDLLETSGGTRIDKCPKVYLEADYDLYVNKGSVTSTSNYLTSIFNNSAAIYANEDVPIEISEIFVWNTADSYSTATSFNALTDFKINRPTFNGDIAHLIAMDPGGLGGVAYTINGLCNTYKYCYSDVNSTYSDFPTYSWTVMVITHEMGHLFGSFHTHSCNWVGGAIDNCYTTEGGCPAGPAPVGGGTIMSYCHLTAYGINFSNGFGAQPGNAIRNTITAAACIEGATGETDPGYCASLGVNSEYEWIQSISINGVSNVSDNNFGYADFSALTAELAPGEMVNVTLTPGYISATAYPEYFSIWIDYNNDLDFNDVGENVYNSGSVTSSVSGTFYVPAAANGETKMRIAMKYNAGATTCELFSYGEVEDYSVSFIASDLNYCNAKGVSALTEWIDKIELNGFIRNSSSDGGYYDGTANVIDLMPGNAYSIKYSAGFTLLPTREFYKAWIDYNQDGDFEDSGEELFARKSKSANNINSSFTVPASALTGKTMFRIAMKNGAYPSPCETFLVGEVEDYTINILPGLQAGLKSEDSDLQVYPNPNDGLFQLVLNNYAEENMLIKIYDMTGRIVYTSIEPNTNGIAAIDCNSIASGLYMIRIYNDTQCIASAKFIKE
ncbi:MAG: GEVED domain-containing protein [Chitinophagales bacterium]|nr:T9SS type A sorting domain-containing protein [Bacteroidota bacterium]